MVACETSWILSLNKVESQEVLDRRDMVTLLCSRSFCVIQVECGLWEGRGSGLKEV